LREINQEAAEQFKQAEILLIDDEFNEPDALELSARRRSEDDRLKLQQEQARLDDPNLGAEDRSGILEEQNRRKAAENAQRQAVTEFLLEQSIFYNDIENDTPLRDLHLEIGGDFLKR
jgi:hypothetical protein